MGGLEGLPEVLFITMLELALFLPLKAHLLRHGRGRHAFSCGMYISEYQASLAHKQNLMPNSSISQSITSCLGKETSLFSHLGQG